MAFSHWLDVFRGWAESPADSIAEAQRWAEKATEYPCSNGLARVVLAYDKLLKGRHEEALATAYKAVQARPSCPTAIGSLANTLLYCGRADEAVERCREAMRLSPLYPPWLVNIAAAAHLTTGDIGTAVAIARQAVAMQPEDVQARLILLGGLLRAELDSEAKNLVGEIVAIDPGFSVARYIQAQPYRDQETASRLAAEFRRAGLPA